MSFIGTIQAGPGADSYKLLSPAIIQIGASTVLNTGTPLRRTANVQGQPPQTYAYAAVVNGVVGGDQAVMMNSVTGLGVYGVYIGPTINNAGVSSVATSIITPLVARTGVVPVLVGTASGGTAVKVGDTVGMSSLISGGLGVVGAGAAAAVPFAQTLVIPASAGVIGTVVGFPIGATLTSTVAAGATSCALSNAYGMNVGGTAPALVVNPGGYNAETVTFTSISAGVMAENNVTFGGSSSGTVYVIFTLGNASTGAIPGIPGGIISVSVPLTASQTAAVNASQATLYLNSVFQTYGAAGNNLLAVNGIAPFGVATSATSVVSITAAVPSPLYNAVTTSWTLQGTSSFASGGTSLGAVSAGSYPIGVATFANTHAIGEVVIGSNTSIGATICQIPQPGGVNVALAMVDLQIQGA